METAPRADWPSSWPPSLALDGYVEAAKGTIQVLGGMGFTWEHDAHIHLRRATTLRQLVGGTAPLRAEAARLALAGRRRRLTIELPPEAERLREQLTPVVAAIAALADPADQRRALADEGLLAPHWPAPLGRDAGAVEQLVIDQVCAEAELRRPNLAVAGWALPTIMAHGTPEQTERFVGPDAAGRDPLVPAVQRAGGRLRPGRPHHPGHPGRGRLVARRPEGVDVGGRPGQHGHLPGPDQPRRAQAPRASPTSWST